jgi:hypothetical protein
MGWSLRGAEGGVVIGPVDFLQDGQMWPRVQLMVLQGSSRDEAEKVASAYLDRARRTMADAGSGLEVVKSGRTEMAGAAAYQYILRQTAQPASAPADASADAKAPEPESMLVAQRVACFEAQGDAPARTAVLLVMARQDDVKMVEKVADMLAGAIEILPAQDTPAANADDENEQTPAR